MHRLCYFLLFLNILNIINSCEYVQNIAVKYKRHFSASFGKISINNQCISELTLHVPDIKTIVVKCGQNKLSQIQENFIGNISTLEVLKINHCDIIRIESGAFANLPQLKTIIIENNPLLEHIPKGLFNQLSLKQIFLRNNRINSIEDEAFANLPSLTIINLSNNNIRHMSKNWFTNTRNIKNVFISNNKIQQVPQEMFSGWRYANFFDFSSNSISIINEDAFKDVASTIHYFSLASNNLKQINTTTFPKNFIIDLDLSSNLFNYLPHAFLQNINVRQLTLTANPFKCNCLADINGALASKGVKLYCGFCNKNKAHCKETSIPVCAHPSQMEDNCVESVDDEATEKLLGFAKELGYEDFKGLVAECKKNI
ncbi:unnamed protein product [Ceutorhynchus assimilis]|uniref:Uncharacterized protein n=1 Tax=Ceutorhynchus assimilis TaxID=467358 RepID=A0A9N9MU52_9CUCU|nr:unnamed protein product [Ceutorhynchus assimilis]